MQESSENTHVETRSSLKNVEVYRAVATMRRRKRRGHKIGGTTMIGKSATHPPAG